MHPNRATVCINPQNEIYNILFQYYIIQIISCAIQTCYCWKGPSIIIAFAVIFHWHLFTISWLIVIFTYQFISNTRVQSPTFDSSRNIVKLLLLFRYNDIKSYFQLYCITAATCIPFLKKNWLVYKRYTLQLQCTAGENGFLSLTLPTHSYRVQNIQS